MDTVELQRRGRKRQVGSNRLCVLGEGFATWVYDDAGTPQVTFFGDEDADKHLSPLMLRITDPSAESALLYELVTLLLGYLHQLVLVADNVAITYGAPQSGQPPWMRPGICTRTIASTPLSAFQITASVA